MPALVRTHPRKTLLVFALALFALSHSRQIAREAWRTQIAAQEAFDVHLNTLRALLDHARRNQVELAPQTEAALVGATAPTDLLKAAATELITQMDTDLPPEDQTFRQLFERYQKEEESLQRLKRATESHGRVSRLLQQMRQQL